MHNKNKYPLFGWNDIIGQAVQTTQGGANLNVNFFRAASANEESNYHVLDTDYETYTIVYNCDNYWGGFAHADVLWILAREFDISESALADVRQIINEKVPHYDMRKDSQRTYQGEQCEYEHMPETPDPTKNSLIGKSL